MSQEILNPSKVIEIGTIEKSGKVVARDFTIHLDEKKFILTVASSSYLEELRQYNQAFDQELQLYDRMLPMESVDSEEDVKKRLSEMERAAVIPYLTEQEED